MKSDKTYAKFYQPLAEHLEVGRKFDGCECVIFSKQENEITAELCDYHSKSIKNGSTKYLSAVTQPAYRMTLDGGSHE